MRPPASETGTQSTSRPWQMRASFARASERGPSDRSAFESPPSVALETLSDFYPPLPPPSCQNRESFHWGAEAPPRPRRTQSQPKEVKSVSVSLLPQRRAIFVEEGGPIALWTTRGDLGLPAMPPLPTADSLVVERLRKWSKRARKRRRTKRGGARITNGTVDARVLMTVFGRRSVAPPPEGGGGIQVRRRWRRWWRRMEPALRR